MISKISKCKNHIFAMTWFASLCVGIILSLILSNWSTFSYINHSLSKWFMETVLYPAGHIIHVWVITIWLLFEWNWIFQKLCLAPLECLGYISFCISLFQIRWGLLIQWLFGGMCRLFCVHSCFKIRSHY